MDTSPRGFDVIRVGETCPPRQVTITAQAIDQFAQLTGDFERAHVDEEYARQTLYGRRIAHGIFILGLMSAKIFDEERGVAFNVSYGYERVRFVRPVFVGDTITTLSTVAEKRVEKREVLVEERCLNQAGELVAIAVHMYKFL